MTKQERTREEKLAILNEYKTDILNAQSLENEIQKKEIRDLLEENENLKNRIEDIQGEIQILTGDLRASADALDDLKYF
jgi:archaellum component FlaC